MVGSECTVGDLGEFDYVFHCRIEYLSYLGSLLLGIFSFQSVGGESE